MIKYNTIDKTPTKINEKQRSKINTEMKRKPTRVEEGKIVVETEEQQSLFQTPVKENKTF